MKAYTEGLINVRDYADIQARQPVLVAHRGGVIAPNAPENSLAAIQLAAVHGYDMVELDIREAKDHVPVLFHGRGPGYLLMDCGVDNVVEALTSEELTTIRYRASAEPIATLAEALALCQSLNVGVMLDIKIREGESASPEIFFQHIADALTAHDLSAATLTISQHPLVQDYLTEHAVLPIANETFERVSQGEGIPLKGRYWFGAAWRLTASTVKHLQRNGAFVIPAINTFHYPNHAHHILARQDVMRLRAAGVDGFQIDSVYEDLFF
jgi:glycerophosphoryl diester phosphodiesterase